MKLLFILLLMFWGCDYAPTGHDHSHEHHDLYSGCCLQFHPSNIAYLFIDPENGVEMSFSSNGAQLYYFNTNQLGCVYNEQYEEHDEIIWSYIDNQTCDELCDVENSFGCFIDSVSILIPNP